MRGRRHAREQFCVLRPHPGARVFARMQVNTICAGTYGRFSGGKLGRFREQPFLDVSPWWERDFLGCKTPGSVRKGKGEEWEKGKQEPGKAGGDWVGAAVELPPPSGNREKLGMAVRLPSNERCFPFSLPVFPLSPFPVLH